MTYTSSGTWSYEVDGYPVNSPTTPPEAISANGGNYKPASPSYLATATEFDSGQCPTLGDYLGTFGYCTEFPAGGWLFDLQFGGGEEFEAPTDCDCAEALDSTGNTIKSSYGGETIWTRQSTN